MRWQQPLWKYLSLSFGICVEPSKGGTAPPLTPKLPYCILTLYFPLSVKLRNSFPFSPASIEKEKKMQMEEGLGLGTKT